MRRGAVVEQLKETGRIEFVRTVEVKSTVSGEIVHLFAEPGQAVSEGDMLAIIRPRPQPDAATLQQTRGGGAGAYRPRAGPQGLGAQRSPEKTEFDRGRRNRARSRSTGKDIKRVPNWRDSNWRRWRRGSNIQQSEGHSSKAPTGQCAGVGARVGHCDCAPRGNRRGGGLGHSLHR